MSESTKPSNLAGNEKRVYSKKKVVNSINPEFKRIKALLNPKCGK